MLLGAALQKHKGRLQHTADAALCAFSSMTDEHMRAGDTGIT